MRRPGKAAVCVVMLAIWACSGGDDIELQAVPHPEMAHLEQAVRDQLTSLQETLERALTNIDVSDEATISAFADLGHHYQAYEFFAAAEVCYLNVRATRQGDMENLYYLAHARRAQGRLDQAVETFAEVLELEPDSLSTLIWSGQLLWDLDRVDEADTVLRRALKLDPASAAVMHKLGQIAARREDYSSAVEYLEQALEIQPFASIVRYPLALAYRELGDREKAAEHAALSGQVNFTLNDLFLRRLEEIATGSNVMLVKGDTFMRSGKFPEAVALYRKALEVDAENPEALLNLGAALGNLGQYEEAEQHLRAAQRLGLLPGARSKVHFNLGTIHLLAGQEDKAVDELHLAIEASPGNLRAHEFLGGVLFRRGVYDEAIGHLQQVGEAEPANASVQIGWATSLYRLGRYPECARILTTAHERLPEEMAITERLAQVLAACPDEGVRDGQKAVDLAKTMFEVRPTFSHAITLAMAFAETGDFASAVQWQEVALESARKTGNQRVVEAVGQDLARYKDRQPRRETFF